MNKQLVFLCVGTSNVVGDSLAPVIGDYLSCSNLPCYVYGTSLRNVNAKNLSSYVNFIKETHKNSLLVVIDAGLSKQEPIGTVKITKGGLKPPGAINKSATKLGDVGILGVVNYYSTDVIGVLRSVKPEFISAFGKYLADLIISSFTTSPLVRG